MTETQLAVSSVPLVSTEVLKSYSLGILDSHIKNTYVYNAQFKVSSITELNVLTNANTTTTFDYTMPNQVKETRGTFVKTYLLNPSGIAFQVQAGSQILNTFTYNSANNLLTDNDGQQLKTNTYLNNNLATNIVTNSNNQIMDGYNYGYVTQLNTIGNDNKGMSFLGKSSVNFINSKSRTAGNPLHIYNYMSSYDANNRLTDYNWTRLGGNQAASFQANYTYY